MLLAQANIALFRWPLTDPRMQEFVSKIDVMNQLAADSDGFIWRYAEPYDGTGRAAPLNHPRLFFNMSVWRDLESLKRYVFFSDHAELLGRKSEWTIPAALNPLVMWWIDAAAPMPTLDEAETMFATVDTDPTKFVTFQRDNE